MVTLMVRFGVPRNRNIFETTRDELVKATNPDRKTVHRIAAKRLCRVIEKNGKEVVYRLYGGREQDAKWTDAITYVGRGKKQKARLNGKAKCEHCGNKIRAYDMFFWRLYGLCSHSSCFGASKQVWLPDYVEVFRQNGRLVYEWERPGGKVSRSGREK